MRKGKRFALSHLAFSGPSLPAFQRNRITPLLFRVHCPIDPLPTSHAQTSNGRTFSRGDFSLLKTLTITDFSGTNKKGGQFPRLFIFASGEIA
ncbi:cell division cycle 2-like protein; cyclin-dependent kinase [Ktedonobacter racemifer DSM 44963]|uniref:Cell division cycle 2-like protein cyclin-dependent kinase n=1 Tax=Ktedonobacter racemifer DSM 44963 TaxID=485913 RepID=D6TC96_KTERA|nr:cell division cycle 2-like protein; cyclin-dependent kinase [Ktedonobacter racemifer DSM 44963]